MAADSCRAAARKHREFALLLTAALSVSMSYGTTLPLLPFLVERMLGANAVAVAWHTGALTGAYTFALFIFSPFWGFLSDRIDRRAVMALGLVGASITLVPLDFALTLPLFYVVRGFGGALSAAVLPAVLARAAEACEAAERPQKFAMIASATTLGFLLGPAIGNWLSSMVLSPLAGMCIAGIFMPDSPFFAVALVNLLSAATTVFLPQRVPDRLQQAVTGGAASLALNQRQVLTGLALTSIAVFGITIAEVGITLLGKQVLLLNPQGITRFFLICGILMIIVQIGIFPVCSQRISLFALLAIGLGISAVGIALIPYGRSVIHVMLAFAAVSGGSAILIPALATLISVAAGTLQGRVMGQQAAAANMGQALAASLTGVLFSMAPAAPFLVGGALAAAGIVMVGPLRKSR